jgi:hypothetical protein
MTILIGDKMTRPIVMIKDIQTGVLEEREMNDDEYAQHLKDIEDYNKWELEQAAAEQEAADTKSAALAKLTALGLSEEEAKAIAG